jgi:hypothetical protein
MEVMTTILLPCIGFLLIGIYNDVKRIARNVEQLMINEAATKEKLNEHDRKVTAHEGKISQLFTKLATYGKR